MDLQSVRPNSHLAPFTQIAIWPGCTWVVRKVREQHTFLVRTFCEEKSPSGSTLGSKCGFSRHSKAGRSLFYLIHVYTLLTTISCDVVFRYPTFFCNYTYFIRRRSALMTSRTFSHLPVYCIYWDTCEDVRHSRLTFSKYTPNQNLLCY